MNEHAARATVAICTRDRGCAVQEPIRAVFAGTVQDFHLLVIDQSDDAATRNALRYWLGDPRLEYVPTPTRGLSRARNVALKLNKSPLLVFTDDDCAPARDWVERYLEAAARQDGPAIFFGPLVADEAASRRGMVPNWRPARTRTYRSSWRAYALGGFGGNMALNSAAIACTGAFNERLGRGEPLSAAEEGEYAFRVVVAGGAIVELRELGVVHFGAVPWPDLRDALEADFSATGHMLAWQLRAGRLGALAQMAYCLSREASVIGGRAMRFATPLGISRPLWLLRGWFAGLTGSILTGGFPGHHADYVAGVHTVHTATIPEDES